MPLVICGEDAAFNGGGRGAGGGAFGRGGGTVVVVCVTPQLSFEDIAGVLAQTVLSRASTLCDCAGVISAVEYSQDSLCTISGANSIVGDRICSVRRAANHVAPSPGGERVCVCWVEASVGVQSLQEDVHQEDHLTFWQAIALANADRVFAPFREV